MMEPRKRNSDRLVQYDKVMLNVSSFICCYNVLKKYILSIISAEVSGRCF